MVENAGRDISDKNSEQSERAKGKTRERSYAKFVLPSNRHGFAVHFDVLRRFVARTRGGQGLPTADMEGEGIPPQAVSLNVRFLKSVGLLTAPEKGKYAATEEATKFINARTVSDDRAKPILAGLVSQQWFAQVAVAQLATQPLMSQDQFVGELALEAQADRAREESALRVLVDYLTYAGLVVRDERGMLSLGSSPSTQTETPIDSSSTVSAPAIEAGSPMQPLDKRTLVSAPAGFHILQAEDFYLRVKSDLDTVQDLMDHLETIKRKIKRNQETARTASKDSPSSSE